MEDFCSQVVTIPQYNETCWFNTILMSLLYSQNSRKFLLHKMQRFNKSNTLLRIINRILKSHYVDAKKAQKYFDTIKPEVILSYIQGIERQTLKSMIKDGWFPSFFLSNFIKSIGCSCIVIDYYMPEEKRKAKLYAGITQAINFYHDGQNIQAEYKYDENSIHKIIKNRHQPDYLCINLWSIASRNREGINKILFSNAKNYKRYLQMDTYNFEYSGIEELDKIIYFNGNTYILDSCIIGNYNMDRSLLGHAIAGITCKSKKYVYNGWMRVTNDKSIHDIELTRTLPCELMPFNWNIHDSADFCINVDKCELPKIKGQRHEKRTSLCFSFNKGDRILIYVKQNIDLLSVNENTINTPSSLSSQRSLRSLSSVHQSEIDKIDVSPINSDNSNYSGKMQIKRLIKHRAIKREVIEARKTLKRLEIQEKKLLKEIKNDS